MAVMPASPVPARHLGALGKVYPWAMDLFRSVLDRQQQRLQVFVDPQTPHISSGEGFKAPWSWSWKIKKRDRTAGTLSQGKVGRQVFSMKRVTPSSWNYKGYDKVYNGFRGKGHKAQGCTKIRKIREQQAADGGPKVSRLQKATADDKLQCR